jgi:ketosteroid isomerase-like protein
LTERLELPETGQVFHAGRHLVAANIWERPPVGAEGETRLRSQLIIDEDRPVDVAVGDRIAIGEETWRVEEIVEDPVNRRGRVVLVHDRRLEVLEEVLDAFNRHDLDAIMARFADDCVFESPRGPDPWGRRFVGRDEVRRGLAARFEGIPDVQCGDGDHFVSGDRAASEWTIRGTTVEGERVEVRGCDLWTFGDYGAIVRKDSFWKLREP